MADIFIPMQGLPANVVCRVNEKVPLSDIDHSKARVSLRLEGLISKLSADRPAWRFVGNYRPHTKEPINEIHVSEDGDEIGWICYQSRNDKFYLTSRQIRAKLSRGRDRATNSEAKAYKYATEDMGRPTLAEEAEEAAKRVTQAMQADRSSTFSDHNIEIQKVMDMFQKYMDNNYEAGIPLLLQIGVTPESVQKLADEREQRMILNAIMLKGGNFVAIRDDVYVIRPKHNATINSYHTCTTDTLPTNIKRGIGLLKLVSDRSFLKDVGYKRNDKQYFILDEVGV